MKRIGAEQGSPTNGLSGPTLVATEITEVERSAEVDLSIGMIGRGVIERFGHVVEARGEDGVHRKPLPVVGVLCTEFPTAAREQVVFAVMER
jgi:hypothetical protein